MAQVRECRGLVIDGYVRDAEAIRTLGFDVFARGLSVNGTYKENLGLINHAVSCGGVIVASGDLVLGDSDGVCVVPKAEAETVLERATAHLQDTFRAGFPVGLHDPPHRVSFAHLDSDGIRSNRWSLVEHTATHVDAPAHFSATGSGVSQVQPTDLIVPIAVVDISNRVADNPGTPVTVADIAHYESEHGTTAGGRGCLVDRQPRDHLHRRGFAQHRCRHGHRLPCPPATARSGQVRGRRTRTTLGYSHLRRRRLHRSDPLGERNRRTVPGTGDVVSDRTERGS